MFVIVNNVVCNVFFVTGSTESGWKEVVKDELIEADLDKVALQIKTHSSETGKVKIHVMGTSVTSYETTIEWSTNPSSTFELQGTCGRRNYMDDTKVKQLLINLMNAKCSSRTYCAIMKQQDEE